MAVGSVPRPQAARIARQLTLGAVAAGAWVSTQAVYRVDRATLLHPAVVVVAGDPPYDGIVTAGALLVVELEARLVQRWQGVDVRVVWAPCGDGVVTQSRDSRCVVAASDVLTVPGYPSLTLPADLLSRARSEASVLDLRR